MSSIVSPFITAMDWNVRFAIPECSAQNRALQEELINKDKQLLQFGQELEHNKNKKQLHTEDVKNLKQTLESTEALYRTFVKEEEMGRHLTALSEREDGQLTQETSKMKNELKLFGERSNKMENHIFKMKQRLQDFKNQMTWDQQTMDAFLEESFRKDEDTMAITKYALQDEQRIKSLTLAIEKKTREANDKRKAQDKELTETHSTQIALDKTTENLRQIHQETQQLIQQWEFSVKQMKQRDNEMQHCAVKLSEIHQQVGEMKSTVTEKKGFLNLLQNDNKETERKEMVTKKLGIKLRQELGEHESNYSGLKDELRTCKTTLERTISNMDTAASHISGMKKEIGERSKKLKTAKAYCIALEEKLKMVIATALSEEERASQIELFLQDEEQAMKDLEVYLRDHREELFRLKQQLQSLRSKEKTALTQISRSNSTMVKFENEQRKVEKDFLQWQINMNHQDTEIHAITIKLERLQGNVKTEEKRILDQKITELTAALEEKKTEACLQGSMRKKVEEDICSFKKKLEKSESQRSNLEDKVEELELHCMTSDKELKCLWFQRQDNMVEQSIVKMEVKRKRDLLYNKTDSMMSLEKQRLEFQRVIKEREEEICISKEQLSQELKVNDQERLKISMELNEKFSKIDQMKKRFDVLTISMMGPEGEEQMSQAYYIIKAAQEKEEMKRSGSSLDAQIQKVEFENRAFENTILLFDNSNTLFRDSLTTVKVSSSDFQEEPKLDEQLKATLRHQEIQFQELQQDFQDMNNTFENLLQEEGLERDRIEDMLALLNQSNKEVAPKQEKFDRATKQCSRLSRDVNSAIKSRTENFEEKDLGLKELKEFSRSTDKMLIEAMEGRPDLRSALAMYFEQTDLALPSPASTPSASSRSLKSSAGNSVTVRSSGSSCGNSPRTVTVELGLDKRTTPPAHTTHSWRSSSGSKNKH